VQNSGSVRLALVRVVVMAIATRSVVSAGNAWT